MNLASKEKLRSGSKFCWATVFFLLSMGGGCGDPQSLPQETSVAPESVAPPTFRVEGRRSQSGLGRGGGTVSMEFSDSIEIWYPGLGLMVQPAATEYLVQMRRMQSDRDRAQIAIIDLVYPMLESPHFSFDRLNADEQAVAAELLLEQAKVFGELDHLSDASASLQLAANVGLVDLDQIQKIAWFDKMESLQRESILCRIRETRQDRIQKRVELAFSKPARIPGTAEFQNSLDERSTLKSHLGDYNLLFTWAMWSPGSIDMLPSISRIHDRYQSQGLRVIPVLFGILDESAKTVLDSNKVMVERLFQGSSPELPSILIPTRQASIDLQGYIGYPGVILMDKNGDASAVIRGYLSLDGLIALVDKFFETKTSTTIP